MINLFISQDDTLVVTVFSAQDDSRTVFAKTEAEIRAISNVNVESITEHNVTFRKPNYKDSVDIFKTSMTTDGESVKVDAATLRYERFIALLVDWDFVDENNEKVSPSRKNVNLLAPELADVISESLEDKIYN
ncbi:MAG: hypothetical protein WDA06_00180 [Phenylobacterium sp.]